MESHEEVKELSDRFAAHRDAIEERLKQEPADDEMRDALEDCEEAIETLEPLLAVDDEDLAKYEETLSELIEKEGSLAERLQG